MNFCDTMSSIWLSSLLCFSITFLLCLAIGISSWLETNDHMLSSTPLLSEHLSLFKVHLYSIKNNRIIYLTFGLWRYCIIDRQSNTNACSQASINFEIDTNKMTEIISKINDSVSLNKNDLLPLSAVSHVRFVLLLLASLGAVTSLITISFLIPGKTRRNWQRRVLFRLVSLKSLIGATLTSVALGVSLRNYRTNISSLCSNLSINQNGYICQSYTSSTETISLAVSIGLFVVCAIHSAACSFAQPSPPVPSTSRANNSVASLFVEDSITSEKVPSQAINEDAYDSYMEKLESHYNNSTSASNRASLRPPPQRQRSVRINNHETPTTEPGVQNPVHLEPEKESREIPLPTSIRQSVDITSANILMPPAPPFANGNNRPSFCLDYRPPSYGSNHTFGALQANYFGTDDSSQTSSCIDRIHKTDSTGPGSSHLMYDSSSAAMQSNHTLGVDFTSNHPNINRNSSSFRCHNNSSFSGEEDVIDLYYSTDDSSNVRSSIPPSQPISNYSQNNDDLYKRIDDYRQFKDK
ncbi:hypothetical protein A0J61_06753 [Choanephora cucurbitarum]|uniref:Uncharacterized protein n=1 Tax=Choanephora cucurbitarum TaxID=101091 RepID=A0A1C7N7Z5_9FUNG|nr:hypothetical protein A0J61_06753 [Choanephora cucurbitarum]